MKSKFNLTEFRSWFSEQKGMSEFFNIGRDTDDPNDKYLGRAVKAKVSEDKIRSRIETEDNVDAVVQEFVDNGGVILSVEGKKIQVEVDSGIFTLPRFCVKVMKAD